MRNSPVLRQFPFQLRAVYLSGSQLFLADDFDPTMPGQPLIGKFRIVDGKASIRRTLIQSETPEDVHTCIFKTKFEFRYIRALDNGEAPPESEEDMRLVSTISADISVDYLITTSKLPSEQDLERIAKSNALAHIWPYWREYCHATQARMNLPLTLMPLFTPDAVKATSTDAVIDTKSKTKKLRKSNK
jgi:hypothetical protein